MTPLWCIVGPDEPRPFAGRGPGASVWASPDDARRAMERLPSGAQAGCRIERVAVVVPLEQAVRHCPWDGYELVVTAPAVRDPAPVDPALEGFG